AWLEALERPLAGGERRQARRHVQALLRPAEGDVHALLVDADRRPGPRRPEEVEVYTVLVDADRRPGQRRHAVDHEQRVVLAARRGQPVERLTHPGGGLAVDAEQRCGALVQTYDDAGGRHSA